VGVTCVNFACISDCDLRHTSASLDSSAANLAVAARCGVLIAHRGMRGECPEAGHQFRQRSAGRRGQHGPGMSEVVEPQVWPPRCPACFVPVPVPARTAARCPPLSVRKISESRCRQRIRHVLLDGGDDVRRIATSRTPASDFGVVVVYVPLVRTAARRMRITSSDRSMSPRRNSTISPNRSAHHDANVTISLSVSGIASVSAASSATLAGRILWTRLDRPAPTMRHGLPSMCPSNHRRGHDGPQ